MLYKTRHFKDYELFPPEVISKYGSQCWQFMDRRVLLFIDWLREELDKSITINDYKWGGKYSGRGYRSNLYNIKSLYASQHLHGRALDFIVEDMSVTQVHNWLINNQYKIPKEIGGLWIERGVDSKGNLIMGWNHVDVRYSDKTSDDNRLYFFNVEL